MHNRCKPEGLILPLVIVCTLIAAVSLVQADSPGYQAGETLADVQSIGSTGRQVDEHGGRVHTVFTKLVYGSPRQVDWNRYSVTGSATTIALDNGGTLDLLPLGSPYVTPPASLGISFVGNFPGFPNLRMPPNGHAFVSWGNVDRPTAGFDASPGGGIFVFTSAPAPTEPDSVVYPKIAPDLVGTDTVIHMIATEADSTYGLAVNTDPLRLYYWRGVVSGVNIVWASPVLLGDLWTYSAVIEASPVSDKVAIVYTSPRAGAADVYDQGVVYRESTDGGLSWGAVDTVGHMDPLEGGAFVDLDAVFDHDDILHVTYNTLARSGVSLRPYRGVVNLWHWNSLRNSSKVIQSSAWQNTCSEVDDLSGWLFNLRLAKPNLIVKPAGEGPGAGPFGEMLYAVWVQFGPTTTDCATLDSAGTPGGHVNGDLWMSVSSDKGLTWDWPQNITGTETPDCLPGNCHSENWVTAAAYADSGIYLSYLDDSHAGSFWWLYRGEPSISRYMVLPVAVRAPALTPRIGLYAQVQPYPRSIGDTEYYFELAANQASDSSFTVMLYNRGTASLNFDVVVLADDGGDTHVQVNGGASYSGVITAAGIPDELVVTYDGNGLTPGDTLNWRVRITSNDPVYDTIHLNLQAVVIGTTATIQGTVFHDLNLNGAWDSPGEPGLEGWVIHAEPGGYVDTTDPSGSWAFTGLPAGTYTISQESQPGWGRTYPEGAGAHELTLTEGEVIGGVLFGNAESECPIVLSGDADLSGVLTSADIIYLVNYVFKGQAGPKPCEASGDVNCSGAVTSADVIYMVSHVFKGQPPPCDACTSSLASDC